MHDHMRTVRRHLMLATALLLMGALAGPAWAVDGVIEINQARALKGGVTTGDEPGFPVTITQPGSYRLTGNLTVPDANTTAVQISTDNVTVDLNGFAIIGPGGTGGGTGIRAFNDSSNRGVNSITVVNGTVQGFGAYGIIIFVNQAGGQASRVEKVRAVNNGGDGIQVGISGTVTGNMANGNGREGISVERGVVTGNTANDNGLVGIRARESTVTGNTVRANAGGGIYAPQGVVTGNTVTWNRLFGIAFDNDESGGYANNVLSHNMGATQVIFGIQMGPNVCGNALCP